MTFDHLSQAIILLSGAPAIWMSQSRGPVRRWACIVGIVGQPFFLYATWSADQWGMFGVAAAVTLGWLLGIWNFWLSPAARRRDSDL